MAQPAQHDAEEGLQKLLSSLVEGVPVRLMYNPK